MGQSVKQYVSETCNDLKNLLPIGTLNFYNLPLDITDCGGLPISDNLDWKWLDIHYFLYLLNGQINPLLKDILFLFQYRYIIGTYKVYRVSAVVLSKVRIYGVPSDISGVRLLNEWRGYKINTPTFVKEFKSRWRSLICHLDYSKQGWVSTSMKGLLLLDCRNTANISPPSDADLNFHVERWSKQRSFQWAPAHIKPDSLFERIQKIYNSITSPDLSAYNEKPPAKSTVPSAEERIAELISGDKTSIPGVKSNLYPFQIRSLSKMVEKESIISRAVSPNFTRVTSPIDTVYYFNCHTNLLYNEPETYILPRGGILAENMGLGKTMICLSLICLTKCDISKVPEDILIYHDEDNDEVQELIFDDHQALTPRFPQTEHNFLTLAEICKRRIGQASLPWKYYIDDLPESIVNSLSDSPASFKIQLHNEEYESSFSLRTRMPSARRRLFEADLPQEGRKYRTLYLCSTTLIVVPDNLFYQWNDEMKKHTTTTFLLKLLISTHFKNPVSKNGEHYTNQLPDNFKELVKYDVILTSSSYLARELGDLRTNENPLNKIYWKRLIIDEGHSMNSKTSRTSVLCRNLHAERRWAVTGTPTSGLTRLHMDEEQDEKLTSPRKRSRYVVKNSFNEREDLVKLGTIISNFLKIEPFHSQSKYWASNIVKPFIQDQYGSETSLFNLLNSIMVRHNPAEIEADLKLPQLHHEAVFLEPSFHNKISINLFTAVLAVNAVSSEREDIDYMFHPANRQQLRRLITNLQRATFHWTGFNQKDVETLIHICELSLNKKKATGESVYSDYDISLLERSIEASKVALSNPRWRTGALLHEMHYYVMGLSDAFTKAFGTGVVEVVEDGVHNDISVFGAPHLNQIQEFFYKHRFMKMEYEEELKNKLELAAKPFWASYWKDGVKKSVEKFNKQDINNDLGLKILNDAIDDAMRVPDVVQNFTPKFDAKKVKKKPDVNPRVELTRGNGDGLNTTDSIHTKYNSSEAVSYQGIKNSQIMGTASAKLSYLTARLLEHQHQGVKSIVFFEFEDSAYYLTELLDVIGINYILYATFIKPTKRASNLADFTNYNSDELGGITLIMDLKLAAHGLTIISATRVYFISPVWQRSIEAQAIKRAHRIGQANEVYVETLVLKGTLEEEIYRRRESSNDDDSNNEKRFVIDDTGMQDYVLRNNFLEHDESEQEYTKFAAPALFVNDMKESTAESLDYSLQECKSTLRQNSLTMLRDWSVFLFNSDNLARLNKAKSQKAAEELIHTEFLHQMTDPEFKRVSQLAIPKRKESTRKKVRF